MPVIVVAGDVIIDWMQTAGAPDPVSENQLINNWRLYSGTRMCARPGGALLLARWIGLATSATVRSHVLGALENLPPSEIIHSIVELDRFAFSRSVKEPKVYRVKRPGGYDGPSIGTPKPLPVADDDAGADMVVLDDACNGFRETPAVWPAALKNAGHQPIVIYKMSRPLASGSLWNNVRKGHAASMVLVVSADDLRTEGVQISRRLSWERTAKDFVWQLAANPSLIPLANCSNLIVRFGIDGAIHVRRTESGVEARLYFDPAVAEDGYRDEYPGEMVGYSSAFVAALSARVVKDGLAALGEGVRDGIRASRRLLRDGFGNQKDRLDYPGEALFGAPQKLDPVLADVGIPNPVAPEPADPSFWCILQEVRGARLEDIAYAVVRDGDAASLREVPVGKFRNLRTVDRAEIESYRGIRNLMLEYLSKSGAERPLSIAVFGPPGSGKSFGVTEVAKSVDPDRVEKLEFNISQFTTSGDLITAFHRVRDIALTGKMPLVFFDEFDSSFQGRLGWLKYFLAPMQDGVFRDGEAIHPIGKAIFVFAGGTCSTYDEFSREKLEGPERITKMQEFRDAKGTDFISRLRGYVNVLGPNPVGETDPFFLIRRAMLLRSLLERKVRHLVVGGQAQIDPGVLRALVKVPLYKHGVRSMEAIIDMSMLDGRRSFEQAALPSGGQLQMHVDAEIFARLVVRDVLFGGARDLLGKAVHEMYREDQKSKKPADDPSMQPWEQLREDLKESNRRQADHIPEKLRHIGCGFVPVKGRDPVRVPLTVEEIEILAVIEHDRYVMERRFEGWVFGPRRDVAQKITPYLVGWDELEEEVREWDRNAVRRIPELLARAGFELYRLK